MRRTLASSLLVIAFGMIAPPALAAPPGPVPPGEKPPSWALKPCKPNQPRGCITPPPPGPTVTSIEVQYDTDGVLNSVTTPGDLVVITTSEPVTFKHPVTFQFSDADGTVIAGVCGIDISCAVYQGTTVYVGTFGYFSPTPEISAGTVPGIQLPLTLDAAIGVTDLEGNALVV